MSAKGLPPAVRLDPLIPHPLSPAHDLFSHCQPECDAKQFRPPPSSLYVVAEAPKSMSKTPPISNNQAAHVKPRGLTPIIITPSSSRAHTPVQLLPLPPSLAFPQPDIATLGKTELKKIKIEPKVEPVNLEPLLPSRREEPLRITVVVDDDEVEARMHVHRNRNDQFNHQLPTPHTTPVTQALDTIHNEHSGDCNTTRGRGPEPDFRYTSIRTGKTLTFASLHLDNVRPLSLDPDDHPRVDLSCPERGFVKERDVIDRGRKRERGPSRFRTHERARQRPVPYDPESRPGGTSKNIQEQGEKHTSRAYAGKLNLGDIAAAAALAMNEADQVNSSSGSTGSSHSLSPHSSSTTSTMTATALVPNSSSSSTSTAAMPPRQGNMPTPTPTPPHLHNSMQQQPRRHQTNQQHLRDVDNSQSRPSRAIHDAAEEMIQLFSSEFQAQMTRERELMQEHLSCERQKLSTEVQRERGALELMRVEVLREREQLLKEREMLRGQVEKEIRAENEALKARVGQLQAALDGRQGGRA